MTKRELRRRLRAVLDRYQVGAGAINNGLLTELTNVRNGGFRDPLAMEARARELVMYRCSYLGRSAVRVRSLCRDLAKVLDTDQHERRAAGEGCGVPGDDIR